MRVLVTGATGFIGSHTTRALLAGGHAVRILARNPAKVEAVFGPARAGLDDVVPGDVTDEACVAKALEGCDAVVHTAALVAMEASRASEIDATNLRGVQLVVGGAHRRGVPAIVYVSSASALFHGGDRPIRPDDAVAAAVDAYGRSKADAEAYVRRLQDAGAPILTTYPTGVVGPDDPGLSEANHAVRTFIGTCVILTSSGFQFVDVRDLAEVHRRLIEGDHGAGRYGAGGPFLPWAELADLLDRLTGRPVRRVPVPGRLLRALGRVGDLAKRVQSFDFPLTGEGMQYASLWPGVDSSRTEQELEFRFRGAEETLRDALRWMAHAGHLDPARLPALLDAGACS
ncbi:MAG: NAD-dependent epimerase/dehydratase family protein [Myxococcota bacterium]|nr:NAD-dependent epimerase/dehydratase family protein [Myxococcota bacterium]